MAGCGNSGESAGHRDLVVFCAASLGEVFSDLAEEFETRHGDVHIVIHTAGSQILVRQIIEGAEADLLAPAHPELMRRLHKRGLVDDPVRFARNRLAIVVPKENPARIRELEDLAVPGTKVILAGPSVPVGRYARESLRRAGLLDAVERNLVSNEANVKLVLSKVLLGEADAGIVYATDIRPKHLAKVLHLPLPEEAGVAVEYTLAVLVGADSPEDANAFLGFVLSDAGQSFLDRYGFETAAEEGATVRSSAGNGSQESGLRELQETF
jgi:molybdate transport system substrate-binding protein